MKPKLPKDDEKYSWTYHVVGKMRHYGISESRIKRIIRFPERVEEGIAPDTVAVMQPAGTKRYQEIWVMYKLDKGQAISNSLTPDEAVAGKQFIVRSRSQDRGTIFKQQKIKIITAWRYPGKSSGRDPVPDEILEEIRTLL